MQTYSANDDMNSYQINNICERPLTYPETSMLPATFKVLALSLAVLIYTMLFLDLLTNTLGLVAYSLLLVVYLYAECRNLWIREKKLFWINPVVLASIFTFVMAFGVSNVLYFFPEDVVDLVGLSPIVTPWMNQLMLLVVLGAVSMWVGYSSGIGRRMGMMLQRSRVLGKWMSPSFRVNRPVLFSCLAISLMAKLVAIKLGVYGYSSTFDQLMSAASYSQYLNLADSLGKLALLGIALQCFAFQGSTIADRYLLWLVLGYEIIFGFLSGMKSSVVMPVILVGIVYYSQRGRFPRWLIPSVVVGLMAAYAAIEPFRDERYANVGFVGTSLGSIVTTMTRARNVNANKGGEGDSTPLKILARLNLTYIGSLGLEFAANHKELPRGSPAFLNDIILAPAHALVPRFLWNSKPLNTIGLWYTNQVVGFDHYTSTAMSPFTYLNFVGGPLAVIFGFLLVGILQRGLFDGLCHFGGGGLIVLLGLLGTLVDINSAFNSFFISLIRFPPILVVAQFVLLQRSRR